MFGKRLDWYWQYSIWLWESKTISHPSVLGEELGEELMRQRQAGPPQYANLRHFSEVEILV